jgi:hypothetical protein
MPPRRLSTTPLRWLVRASLAAGLVLLCYSLFQGTVRGVFTTEHIGTAMVFCGAWIVPALARGTWNNSATGRQSIAFYGLSLRAIGLIACLGLFILAAKCSFS